MKMAYKQASPWQALLLVIDAAAAAMLQQFNIDHEAMLLANSHNYQQS